MRLSHTLTLDLPLYKKWKTRLRHHIPWLATFMKAIVRSFRKKQVRNKDEVRRRYALLIDSLSGNKKEARKCARLAVKQGVWKDPMQRPMHYIPSLPSISIHDPKQFWFTGFLEENFHLIREEFERVTGFNARGFHPVEEPLIDSGKWDLVTFYEGGRRMDRACERFPVTAGLLDSIPEALQFPGVVMFSWLHPGTHIVPHCGNTNTRLRVHMGIKVPTGACMRVGNQFVTWEEGKCLVFDDTFEHEVWNTGQEPRIILMLDIFNPALSKSERLSGLSKWNSIDDTIREFMISRNLKRIEKNESVDLIHMLPDHTTEIRIRRYMQENQVRAVEILDGELHFDT